MKKSLKSLISILTIAMMLLAFAPASMAAATVPVPATMPATITVFRDGADTSEATAILTDGAYYIKGDGFGAVASNTDKVISFNSANSGIKWSFTKITPVKRIDLWVLDTGAIDQYVIETRNSDSEEWKTVHTGTLAMYDEFDDNNYTGKTSKDLYDRFYSDDTSVSTFASYYPVILPQNVSAKEVRFRIVSFPTSINGTQIETAHISQAMIYDTNEIDFWPYHTAYNKHHCAYRYGYAASNAYNSNGKSNYRSVYTGAVFAYDSKQYIVPYKVIDSTTQGVEGGEDAIGKMWYATSFERSKIKINRIVLDVTAGTITGVKIRVTTDNHIGNGLNNTNYPTKTPLQYIKFDGETPTTTIGYVTTSTQSWTEEPVYTLPCNITSESNEAEKTIDIPQAVASSDIYLEFEYDEEEAKTVTPKITAIHMYSVADYELNPGITKSDLSGTVAAGETVTLNLATKELTNANAKIYFAVYSGDELKAASAVGCPFTGTATYAPTYTIPSTAGDNLTLKVFIWDGTTLVPLLNTPVVVGQ